MAEARGAVAFGFHVTHEGFYVSYDRELLHEIWSSIRRSYKRRVGRFKNNFLAGIYPATPGSLVFAICVITGLTLIRKDPSAGLIQFIQRHTFGIGPLSLIFCAAVFSVAIWFIFIQIVRLMLKVLFMYKGWFYERVGKSSKSTMLYLALVQCVVRRRPMLNSFQGALPRLPLPSLDDTERRHLRSVRPLLNDEEYENMNELWMHFRKGIGRKLQGWLRLKSWFSSNYVSDWWEQYIYLRGRSPIMINSNYYGIDTLFVHQTRIPAARAANIIASVLEFRRLVERQELKPLMIFGIPLCSYQYDRMFNTTRVPGIEEDTLRHWDDSRHIAVWCKGCWFKLPVHNGYRLLTPAELEWSFQMIIDMDESPENEWERKLGALTAGDRTPWAEARKKYFRKGINKQSLDVIERAAIVVCLDDEIIDYDKNDPEKLDKWAHVMLHGKGYNRWFDKSIQIIVAKNGRVGFNCEHAWADAPVMSHTAEYGFITEGRLGYKEDGHVNGELGDTTPPKPVRLRWEIPEECHSVIDTSLKTAEMLISDVEMRLLVFQEYGKGFIKKCRVSPDAYLQMALQLANYRDQGKFCLTYEASMTRLFREGRTETVRSCTNESAAFVLAMENPQSTDEERFALLRAACENHVKLYRDAMCGKGVDRHLFALYVVSKWLEIESPLLEKILREPWRLSTSQTPHQQTDLIDFNKHSNFVSGGGGFGPVADDGYGVSYMIAGENTISFHVSSKLSAKNTSSMRFRNQIFKALMDMRELFQKQTKAKPGAE